MAAGTDGLYTPEQRTHDLILGKLAQLELDHDVEVLFAVESGSRAWGFPSPDSDYDVRFVYRRKPQQYLRLLKQPDTLGRPVKGAQWDVTGWDVGKALTLGLKSNATLLEWLRSPIRYRWSAAAEELKRCVELTTERKGLVYNYYNLARTFWEKEVQGKPQVVLKQYLYGLRPALALRHMRLFPGIPPMNIDHLLEGADVDVACAADIAQLRQQKAAARELGTGARIASIDLLIQQELELAAASKPQASQLVDDAKLLEMAERTYLRLVGMTAQS